MFKDDLKYHGTITVHKNGIVLFKKSNLIVTAGKGFAASRLGQNTANPISHIGIGADNAAPAVGNTTLGNELGRVAAAFSVAGAVGTWETTFGPGVATGTLTEAGLFTAASAGTMFSRVVFAAVPKGAGDSITVTWTVEAQA